LPEETTLIEVTIISDLTLKKAFNDGEFAQPLHVVSAAKRVNVLACGAENSRVL
jgi:hypothetical protein